MSSCQSSNKVTSGHLVWMLLCSLEELARSLSSRELKLLVNIRKETRFKVIFFVLDHLKPLGMCFDPNHNDDNGKRNGGVISSENSKVKVLVIKTNEERMIADKVLDLFGKRSST